MKKVETKTVEDLANDLVKVYNDLRNEEVNANHAKGLANVVNVVIKSQRLIIDYDKQTGTVRDMPLMLPK